MYCAAVTPYAHVEDAPGLEPGPAFLHKEVTHLYATLHNETLTENKAAKERRRAIRYTSRAEARAGSRTRSSRSKGEVTLTYATVSELHAREGTSKYGPTPPSTNRRTARSLSCGTERWDGNNEPCTSRCTSLTRVKKAVRSWSSELVSHGLHELSFLFIGPLVGTAAHAFVEAIVVFGELTTAPLPAGEALRPYQSVQLVVGVSASHFFLGFSRSSRACLGHMAHGSVLASRFHCRNGWLQTNSRHDFLFFDHCSSHQAHTRT